MCGICGVFRFDDRPADAEVVQKMNSLIHHRGPDQGRVLADGPCALGNRRLAILDLSPAGALPMVAHDGAFTMAYNGEVYSYPTLKQWLESDGYRFQSGSDAEAIIEWFRRRGTAALDDMRGMFALALWDKAERRLLLARDRTGQKPLYYYQDERVLVFGSEIKSLLAHPDVPRRSALTPDRLAQYLSYGYTPAPETAFEGIHMLPPGHFMQVDGPGAQPRPYWTPPTAAEPEPGTETSLPEAVEQVRALLDEATRLRLISDVPLGAFLSGGLDSSLIVALMRQHSSAAVKTFSIGFTGDDSFDETHHARRVADLLGTDHTAFTVEPQALDLLPKLVWHHDQPFADSSAIPTFLVSQLTREHVTVALTGDGGDELFAGYERFYAASLAQKLGVIPRPVWRGVAGILGALPEGTGYYNVIKRAGRFARGASQPLALAYFDWVRLFDAEAIHALTDQADHTGAAFAARFGGGGVPGLLDANLQTYLPDDLLIKADRASMAASLEARAPFLDHELLELAASLPLNLKLNGRITKHVLKEAARGLLPDDIIDRPKHGFGVPLGAWLRADDAIVRETLLSQAARQRGLLDMNAVTALIDEHVSGGRDHGHRLWTLLTLEWWHRLFIDSPALEMP